MKRHSVHRLVGISVLMAIIVVLQLLANFFKVGAVSITLVLVPIVVGAAVYGQKAGAILGATFGVISYICCANGSDLGGSMLFQANPFYCALICMVKATAAGFCAGAVYGLCSGGKCSLRRSYLSALVAGIAAPVVNTGIFCAAMPLFYMETLKDWAGSNGFGGDLLAYTLLGLAGINFLIELGINIVCSPAIATIIRAKSRS